MKRALLVTVGLALAACAPAAAPIVIEAPTTASVAAKPVSCHFEASRTLRERAHDLDSPSPEIALDATAAVLAESCSGPLASLAARLAAEPVNRRDAVLSATLASLVPAACFSTERSVARSCPVPWSVISLWESEEEWAESRFFRESDRPLPAAVVLGPRLALAAAIVGASREGSFTARSLAAHVLYSPDRE